MSDTANRRLGDYELVELLGDGPQGKIYQARRVTEGDAVVPAGGTVALKVLRQGDDDSPAFREQIDKLINLTHPNIARYLDSFVYRDEWGNDMRCLVMEFLEGEDLHHCMQRHPAGLPWERVRSIFEQCAAGLVHACSRGVVHSDIKSSNIYLLTDGTVKVTDFGVSRSESKTVTTQGGGKGSFDFMAPDFLTADEDFQGDEVSDVFSLGVCFYEAMTGRYPYPPMKESGLMGYLRRWQQGDAVEPDIAPRVFRVLNDRAIQFVRKCLSRDRGSRYQSFEAMGADLARVERRSLRTDGGRYLFEEYLGKGGFGEVFRARREKDNGIFSVKHLFPSHDPVRFLREARLLREHPHANLVAYEDFVKVDRLEGDDYYLIMEFLEGMPHWSLRSRIRQEGGLDITEVVRLFSAYCDALQYLHSAHRKPVVHRDLTPANLYAPPWDPARPEERRPKVFDLGIARSDKTQTGGSVPGNPEYMPPEFVLDPDFRGSPQSDLFNLGLCLYEALCGRPAYARLPKGTTEMWHAMRSRAEGKVAISFEADVFRQYPRLADVVRRATQRNPRKRFASAAQMKEILVDSAESEDETMDFYGEEEQEWETQAAVSAAPAVSSARPPTAREAVAALKPGAGVGRLLMRIAAGIGVAAVIGGVIVGGYMAWRNATEGKLLKEIRTFPGDFRLTATDVGRCRKLIEDADAKADAGDEKVEKAMEGLCQHWSSIPDLFEQGFAESLDDGELAAAEGVYRHWERSVEHLPFRDINLAIHGKRLAGMERRMTFAGTVVKLEDVDATVDYATRLGDALALAHERATAEGANGAGSWWKRQGTHLSGYAAELPQVAADDLTRLLADESGLAEAEELVGTWSRIARLEFVTERLPADAAKPVDKALTRGMTRLIEGKKSDVVSAYGKGDEAGAKEGLAWIADSRTRYPALCGPVAPLFEGVSQAAAKAQAAFLEAEIGKIPSDLGGGGLANAVAGLKSISARYEKWRKGWNADLSKDIDKAGTGRCKSVFEKYAGMVSSAYGKHDTDSGDRNMSLLKQFAEAVPKAFGAEELETRIAELTKIGDAVADLQKDLKRALDTLDNVARAFGSDDPAAWKQALDEWRTARFKEGVRVRDEVVEKVEKAGGTLKETAAKIIAVSEKLDALSVVREVLAEAIKGGMLGQETVNGLLALIVPRETLLRLRAFEGPLGADAPAGWRKALDAWAAMAVPDDVRADQAVAQEWAVLDKAFAGAAAERIAPLTAMADVDAMDELLTAASTKAVISGSSLQKLTGLLAEVRVRLRGLAELAGIRDSIRDGEPETWKKAIKDVAPFLKTEAYRQGGKLRDICDEVGASVAAKLEAHVGRKGTRQTMFAGLTAVSEIVILARDGGLLDAARADGISASAARAGLRLAAEPLVTEAPATWLQAISDLVKLAPVVKNSADDEVVKLRKDLAGRIAGYVRDHAARTDPLEGRVQRIKESEAALTSAARSGLFEEEVLTAARDVVAAEGKLFVLRVVNPSNLETEVDVGGKVLGRVPVGKQADFRLAVADGQVSAELSAGGAFYSQTEQFTPTGGGAKSLQIAGWRPRPRKVDISALKGTEGLAMVYTRRSDAKQVVLDAHSELLPGVEYELLYRRPGFIEQKHALKLEPGVEPVALPAAAKWVETQALGLLGGLEQAVARGDLAAAEAVFDKLDREALAKWPGCVERFDKALAEWRKLKLGGAAKTWDSAVAKWNDEDHRGAASDFNTLAEVFAESGMKGHSAVCRLNKLLAVFLYSGGGNTRRTPARAIVKLCDDNKGFPSIPPDRKRALDSVLARMRSYLTLSPRMASLEEINLVRDVPKVGPVPLPK